MKYLAFDLEIAKTVPFNQALNTHRPLGITCAAGDAQRAVSAGGAGERGSGGLSVSSGDGAVRGAR